ncbi:antitoxin Xre/MbcA/ParS toxin-binding domain-containing protein [Pseudoduganella chitinolytica]|uniref:antitoxin Xre/MbcA/ParS toxin-binding domain-containing protein n=1 Tax=Pseudoduganella chitinolytica TaxID=34070 RepID=UPI0035308DB2
MTNTEFLRDEYPGDLAWQSFLEAFDSEWSRWPEKELYQSRLFNSEFAAVLTSIFGIHSVDWLIQPCAALGNRSPIDVLENESDGDKIIRSLIMRIPI